MFVFFSSSIWNMADSFDKNTNTMFEISSDKQQIEQKAVSADSLADFLVSIKRRALIAKFNTYISDKNCVRLV